jgi:hypothetical protein
MVVCVHDARVDFAGLAAGVEIVSPGLRRSVLTASYRPRPHRRFVQL